MTKKTRLDVGGQSNRQTAVFDLLSDALDIHATLARHGEDPAEVLCERVFEQLGLRHLFTHLPRGLIERGLQRERQGALLFHEDDTDGGYKLGALRATGKCRSRDGPSCASRHYPPVP